MEPATSWLAVRHADYSASEALFSLSLPVQILKALLPSSMLAPCLVHLSLPDLLTNLTILIEHSQLEENPVAQPGIETKFSD